eukprot:scaffold10008_cov148-Skeletonema_menzelii.AAC.1
MSSSALSSASSPELNVPVADERQPEASPVSPGLLSRIWTPSLDRIKRFVYSTPVEPTATSAVIVAKGGASPPAAEQERAAAPAAPEVKQPGSARRAQRDRDASVCSDLDSVQDGLPVIVSVPRVQDPPSDPPSNQPSTTRVDVPVVPSSKVERFNARMEAKEATVVSPSESSPPELSVHNSHPADISVVSTEGGFSKHSQVVIDRLEAENAKLRAALSTQPVVKELGDVVEPDRVVTQQRLLVAKAPDSPVATHQPQPPSPTTVAADPATVVQPSKVPREPEGTNSGVDSVPSSIGTYDRNDSFIASSPEPPDRRENVRNNVIDPPQVIRTDYKSSPGFSVPGAGWTTPNGCCNAGCLDADCTDSGGGGGGVPQSRSALLRAMYGGDADSRDKSVLSVVKSSSKGHIFFTREAAAASAGDIPDPSGAFLSSAFQVLIPKDERLKPGEPGYTAQREKMYLIGSYKLKESEKLGGWNRDSTDPGKASQADDAVKKYKLLAALLKQLRKHLGEIDLTSLVEIPIPKEKYADNDLTPTELHALHPLDIFELDDSGSFELMNVFEQWAGMSLSQIKLYQRLFTSGNPAVTAEDMDSNQILFHAVNNSLSADLQTTANKLYELHFSEENHERGGIAYLYTVLCKVLLGSSANVEALHTEYIKFINTGPTYKSFGENITALVEYVKTVLINPLIAMNGFRTKTYCDPLKDVYSSLAKSSVPVFAEKYKRLWADHINESTSGISALNFHVRATSSSAEIGSKIITILDEAADYYELLTKTGDYKTKNGKALTFSLSGKIDEEAFLRAGCTCHNCGGKHHLANCPEEIDEDRVARAKKAHADAKKKKKSGDDKIPTRDASGETKDGSGGGSGKKPRSWRLDPKNKSTVQFKCLTCGDDNGRWGNHTTDMHEKATSFGPTFNMAKTAGTQGHPGVKKIKELSRTKDSTTPADKPSTTNKKGDFQKYREELKTLEDRKSTLAAGSELYQSCLAEINALTAKFEAQHFH